MLAVTSYSVEHVERARLIIDQQLVAYSNITSTPEFDAEFFRNLVLVLDRCFVHRMRGAEGKDGNALNEVRMLCDAILLTDGILRADKTIKYDPNESVLHLAIGDKVNLDLDRFRSLSDHYFAEIENRFT